MGRDYRQPLLFLRLTTVIRLRIRPPGLDAQACWIMDYFRFSSTSQPGGLMGITTREPGAARSSIFAYCSG